MYSEQDMFSILPVPPYRKPKSLCLRVFMFMWLSVLQLTITICSQYHIDKGDLTWATVFKKLEENKEQLCIEDYSVSQTTLEQVFINFARAQVPPDDEKPSLGRRIKQTCCICCVPEYVVANNVPIKGPGSHRNGEATA